MSDLLPIFAPYSGWLILLLLLMIGICIAAYGLLRDRRKPYPRCPKCRYNLTGFQNSSNDQCPECGEVIHTQANLYSCNRSYRLIILGLLFAFALPIFIVQRRVRQYGWIYYTYVGPLYYLLPDVVIAEKEINGFKIIETADRRAYYTSRNDITHLTIATENDIVIQKDGFRWQYDIDGRSQSNREIIGQDITGNNYPNIVFFEWTGGAHCCYPTTILEQREDQTVVLFDDDLGNSSIQILDLNNDGIQELIVRDQIFAYWKTSYAGSPLPQVIYQFDGDQYVTAANLMLQPPRTDKQQIEIATRINQSMQSNTYLDAYYSYILTPFTDLVYSGNASQAFELLDSTWPENVNTISKDQFISEFKAQIRKSPHYQVICQLNGDIFED
ncbi:hypothetical protein KS4_25600 [Poriferisphaera corsica]|uniref:VCBS repeat-containing protein n=1 Tax=Poriferisphaera corsica TaxID=2528020 RepID=A0A517YW83_9BACT|nr:hypothetical protein [Poriferisphaera corsica]QDU34490.1 hypothetical protein KS4_25600 [Poriferisphaera corsica]